MDFHCGATVEPLWSHCVVPVVSYLGSHWDNIAHALMGLHWALEFVQKCVERNQKTAEFRNMGRSPHGSTGFTGLHWAPQGPRKPLGNPGFWDDFFIFWVFFGFLVQY